LLPSGTPSTTAENLPGEAIALGVEPIFAAGTRAPLDSLDLTDDLAVARQSDIALLDEHVAVRRPSVLHSTAHHQR